MHPRRPRYVSLALAGFLLTAAAAACGDTTGTTEARVSAEVHDETSSGVQAASIVPLAALQSSGYSGTVSGDARVEVSADGETWTELDESSQVEVDLQASGGGATVHADASVPLESFTRVRLVLDGADARLEAGSTVGGVTLDSETTVTLGSDGQAVVEVQLDQSLDASADTDAMISFDLNSEAWITESAVTAGAVAASEIESATVVTVEQS